jgi:hypothetical protein
MPSEESIGTRSLLKGISNGWTSRSGLNSWLSLYSEEGCQPRFFMVISDRFKQTNDSDLLLESQRLFLSHFRVAPSLNDLLLRPHVDSGVSSYDVRSVPQVGRRTNQINCCNPYSSDFRTANTKAVLLALKEQITAAASISSLEKRNLDATFICTGLAWRSYCYEVSAAKVATNIRKTVYISAKLLELCITLNLPPGF